MSVKQSSLPEKMRPPASNPPSDAPISASQDVGHQQNTTKLSLRDSVTTNWTALTQKLHYGISKFVLTLSLKAARNPKKCIGLVSAISILLLVVGLTTNFTVKLDDEDIYAPVGCRPIDHWNYVASVEGFPRSRRPLIMLIHADGGNVMEKAYEGMKRIFQATDLVTGLEDYDTICSISTDGECRVTGPTRYWDHNITQFEKETQGSDQAVRETLSQEEFWAVQSYFLGNYQQEGGTGTLINYAESIAMVIELPEWSNGETEVFEGKIIDGLFALRESWMSQTTLRLEFYTWRSIPDEMTRAVTSDLPLIPFVFIIMTSFTCMIFYRKDKVKSRALLGVGSMITIVCSIMSGFGVAFICGLPFTSMTQILPFVIFGVGLDDTFIITGAYFRTDPNRDPVERIRSTMEEVGSSISLTTTTTTLAFFLGFISSSIPTIQWLCVYAFLTIFIDFIYQITFFVAILVLDENRIKANRRDCCICWKMEPTSSEEDDIEMKADDETQPSFGGSGHAMMTDRIMEWYADHLLRPRVKVAVLVVFTVFIGGCIYSATRLQQEFKPEDFLPDGSYAYGFIDATNTYTDQKLKIMAYFRDVDQSDPAIQQQMLDYVNDLSEMPQIQRQPDYCWIRDFKLMQNGSNPALEQYSYLFESNITFTQQLDLMLSVPEINELYGQDIARNEAGEIEASRCLFTVNYVDLNLVREQIKMLADQRQLTAAQPINADREDFAFFSLDLIYFIWEFYTVAINELIFTTVSGVVAVSFIAFVLIPHWTAVLFVLPLMIILYVDLLGTLQFAGLSINPLTYICLVMSIGLLVDFLLHLILRYYESTEITREGKVKDTLKTMGSSIFVGGLSTLLGVVPLAFSTSGIIKTVFVLFFAMVSLGLANGLILLPVILSYVGPTVCVRMSHQHQSKSKRDEMRGQNNDLLEAQTTGSQSSGEDSGQTTLLTVSSACNSSKAHIPHDKSMVYQDGAWVHQTDSMDEIEV